MTKFETLCDIVYPNFESKSPPPQCLEIRKEFGLKMEHITTVRDASRSSKEGRDVIVHGYHGCMAVACQNGKRKTVPLTLKNRGDHPVRQRRFYRKIIDPEPKPTAEEMMPYFPEFRELFAADLC